MKRSTKRSMFLQILLFSISVIYTMIFDKKQEHLLFATGNIYRETGATSQHVDSAIDEWLEWRVKWGQRGAGVCGLITLVCYIVSGGANVWLQVATVVFCIITLLFACMFYYKNISFVVVKRLLCEPNVIVIVVLTLCNCIIDIGQPYNPFSPINGIMYMLIVYGFVFMDALKVKSRVLVIVIGSIFTLLNI